MQLPGLFLDSLEGIPGFDRPRFEAVHAHPEQITAVRLNTSKMLSVDESDFQTTISKVPWADHGYYLEQRPSFTFDPLFHAGTFYVQDASSMFLEQALKQHTNLQLPLRVLDLSAAPGGKTTHIQSLISNESLLVANEVIRNRAMILRDNVIKWGASNVIITNNDPSVFKKLTAYFDVIVVDAPCSGSGLFRKDADAVNEWSLNNVALCSQRQQRILADVLPALKQDGLLIYSTCSYSIEEDEAIGAWLENDFDLKGERIAIKDDWGIVETHFTGKDTWGYRFYPDQLKGEGFYLSCFRKTGAQANYKLRFPSLSIAGSKEKSILLPWINAAGMELIADRERYYALPANIIPDAALLRSVLNIQYWGTEIGQIMKGKLVPEHALALSNLPGASIHFMELERNDAIKYLQRQEMGLLSNKPGWQTVRYRGFNLGWINALPNRINNYYPKALRIIKQHND